MNLGRKTLSTSGDAISNVPFITEKKGVAQLSPRPNSPSSPLCVLKDVSGIKTHGVNLKESSQGSDLLMQKAKMADIIAS